MREIERIKEFGGWLNRYQHESTSCNCTMTFSVYLPTTGGEGESAGGLLALRADLHR